MAAPALCGLDAQSLLNPYLQHQVAPLKTDSLTLIMCKIVARKLSVSQSETQAHQKQTTAQTGSICGIIKMVLGAKDANH